MAIIFRRKRATRKDYIFAGWFTLVLTVMITVSAITAFTKGEINIAGPIMMPLIMIPWPLYFFGKAHFLAEEEKARQARIAAEQKQRAAETPAQRAARIKRKQEEERQHKLRMQANQERAAFLKATKHLKTIPSLIVFNNTKNDYIANADFVVTYLDGHARYFPASEAQGVLLGKFEFRNGVWNFTNLAPKDVSVKLRYSHPVEPMEQVEIFPPKAIDFAGKDWNAYTLVDAAWKK